MVGMSDQDLGPAHLLDRALALVAGEWESADVIRWLSTKNVLAEAWKPIRLEDCRKRLAAGEKAPTIKVVGHRLGRKILYSVSDGNHRTIAAREVGRKIKAHISGYYRSEPERHVLWQGGCGG